MHGTDSSGGTVIGLGGYQQRLAIAGAVVGLLIGGSAAVSAVLGEQSATASLALGGLGLLGLGFAVLCGLRWQRARGMALVVEQAGIRIVAPGRAAAVPWADLAAVSVSVASGSAHTQLKVVTCYLDLFPAATSFPQRHPGMAFYLGRNGLPNGYRVLIGGEANIARLQAALAQHAAERFLGVRDA